jgi:hypothetical protein
MLKARDFDEKFDAGGDVSRDVDWAKALCPNLQRRRITSISPPGWWKGSTEKPDASA